MVPKRACRATAKHGLFFRPASFNPCATAISAPTLTEPHKLFVAPDNSPSIAQMERLVRKDEYDDAKKFISRLRAKSDPPPQVISPPLKFKGAQKQRCVENVVKYCMKNTEYEPAKGFKLWVLPTLPAKGQSTPYVALVHMVVRHKESGKYIDVTPPDKGDEGQQMIFIPSSRVYPDWSVSEIADYCKKDLQIRMGGICTANCLEFKQMTTSDVLYKATPEELKLFMCPKMSTVQENMFGLPSEGIQVFLESLGATFMEVDKTLYCMVGASEYRHLYQCAEEAVKVVDKEEESGVEEITAAVEVVHVD